MSHASCSACKMCTQLRWTKAVKLVFKALLVSFDGFGAAAYAPELRAIQCNICWQAIEEASVYIQAHQLYDEDDIADLVDSLCSVGKDEGRWIRKLDIVHIAAEGQLRIDKHDLEGICRNECKLVSKSCSRALKGMESELASLLMNRDGDIDGLRERVCSKSCNVAPMVWTTAWADEDFKPQRVSAQITPELVVRDKRCGSSDLTQGWIGPQSLAECHNAVLSISDCYHTYFFHATETDKNCGCVQRSAGFMDNCETDDQHPHAGVHLYRLQDAPPAVTKSVSSEVGPEEASAKRARGTLRTKQQRQRKKKSVSHDDL